MSQTAADCLGCSKSNISAFAKNGTTPKGEAVAGAARMLDVSADYLLGLTDNAHPIEMLSEHTETERKALEMFRELNPEGQEAALAMISGLVSQGIYKKGDTGDSVPAKIG